MSKHNKKRNTAFVYEILLREVVKQSVAKNYEKRNIAIGILKEFFKKRTHLRQELDLYKILLQTRNLSERLAERLVTESIHQHQNINSQELFKEQSALISSINKKLSKNSFLNFVPNYKDLATISQLFSDQLNPKSKVLLETKIAKSLMKKNQSEEKTTNVSNLVIQTFTQRFNETYGEMLQEQKETLQYFINSFSDNGTEFKFYLNEELGRLKNTIEDSYSLVEIQHDRALRTKLDDVKEILDNFHQKPLNRTSLIQVLKIQTLANELATE